LGLALDEPKENETAVKVSDINVLISEDIKNYAAESKIDYIDKPYQRGFTVGSRGLSGC
jgi:Fe-S cluster assembly iron-binding protein IscA